MLVGGARSGKSALAVRLAAGTGAPVQVVATGEGRDDEMAERIARHRAERPPGWVTVEEPIALEQALSAAPPGACVIVDCLTLWTSNLLEAGCADVDRAAAAAAGVAAARPGATIAVTNEVGSGLVPTDAGARRYRDVLGRVNAAWVEAADRALLLVAGRAVPLVAPEALLGE